MLRPLLISSFFSFSTTAFADVPRVVTDIAPIQSLVAQVMGDLAEPDLLIPSSSSPHSFALRPSQAEALEQADIVFWIGDGLTPWLEPLLDRVAAKAKHVSLIELPETHSLEFRSVGAFEPDEHEHDDHDHDGNLDPHAWLDPNNAQLWLKAIAAELSNMDPSNAAIYGKNAQVASDKLTKTVAEIEALLEDATGKSFITFHDAYHYFEDRFGLRTSASISLSDASAPSPARVDRIQTYVRENNVSCAFSEPQFSAGLVRTVLEGTNAGIAELDPLGAALDEGPELYPNVLRAMAEAIAGC